MNIAIDDIPLKAIDSLVYISLAESIGVSSNTFTEWALKATEFCEITQNKGHYVLQGHSRSPSLVAIESSFAI